MMRDWIVIVVLYLLGMGLFSLLGGFRSAGEALQQWGRAWATRHPERCSSCS
jgi:hypothetical protein